VAQVTRTYLRRFRHARAAAEGESTS
jgi:hypothetical protein